MCPPKSDKAGLPFAIAAGCWEFRHIDHFADGTPEIGYLCFRFGRLHRRRPMAENLGVQFFIDAKAQYEFSWQMALGRRGPPCLSAS